MMPGDEQEGYWGNTLFLVAEEYPLLGAASLVKRHDLAGSDAFVSHDDLELIVRLAWRKELELKRPLALAFWTRLRMNRKR